MNVLALDLSSSTGWAVVQRDNGKFRLVGKGLIATGRPVLDYGDYPWAYLHVAGLIASSVLCIAKTYPVDRIIIEETNKGQNRYHQKLLEFIHCRVLDVLGAHGLTHVSYVNTKDWRKQLGISLSKADKRANAKLSKAKRVANSIGSKLDKKALGISGRITWKHLSVRYANERYGLNLKIKDNDIADAICIGTAYLDGAPICTGK